MDSVPQSLSLQIILKPRELDDLDVFRQQGKVNTPKNHEIVGIRRERPTKQEGLYEDMEIDGLDLSDSESRNSVSSQSGQSPEAIGLMAQRR